MPLPRKTEILPPISEGLAELAALQATGTSALKAEVVARGKVVSEALEEQKLRPMPLHGSPLFRIPPPSVSWTPGCGGWRRPERWAR